MVKQVTVTFDYNAETDEITNTKVHVEGEVKKKARTKSKPKDTGMDETHPMIVREDNRLVLNNAALDLLQAEPGDRIHVAYDKDGADGVFPKVSIDDRGNKLSKGLTVRYGGNNNSVLGDYGTTFILEELSEGVFRMNSDQVTSTKEVGVGVDSVEEAIALAEDVEPDLYIDDTEESFDLDELSFRL